MIYLFKSKKFNAKDKYNSTLKVVADIFRDIYHFFRIAQNVFPFQQSYRYQELLFCRHVVLMTFCG